MKTFLDLQSSSKLRLASLFSIQLLNQYLSNQIKSNMYISTNSIQYLIIYDIRHHKNGHNNITGITVGRIIHAIIKII
jgi:hypothetical protein